MSFARSTFTLARIINIRSTFTFSGIDQLAFNFIFTARTAQMFSGVISLNDSESSSRRSMRWTTCENQSFDHKFACAQCLGNGSREFFTDQLGRHFTETINGRFASRSSVKVGVQRKIELIDFYLFHFNHASDWCHFQCSRDGKISAATMLEESTTRNFFPMISSNYFLHSWHFWSILILTMGPRYQSTSSI